MIILFLLLPKSVLTYRAVIHSILRPRVTNELLLIWPVSVDFVMKEIRVMNSSKATRDDGIIAAAFSSWRARLCAMCKENF